MSISTQDPILDFLKPGSPFGLHLKGFEPRQQQLSMMADILSAYRQNRIALIEAGTGIGKSLAYLIPAILWSKDRDEKTLISTATIALQEQLMTKDIPLTLKALGVECKAVLIKGMGNYVCLRKLDEAKQELLLMSEKEREAIQLIDAWTHQTHDGTRATLPMAPSYDLWEKINAESDNCARESCAYHKQCFFFKARKEAQDAQLLIANHHLLCSDLSYRLETDNFNNAAILPTYHRVVLDEAHHIEHVATEFFAQRLGLLELMKLLGRISAESQNSKTPGKLPALKERLMQFQEKQHMPEIANILTRITSDFATMRHQLLKSVVSLFESLDYFSKMHHSERNLHEEESKGSYKFRLRKHHFSHPMWLEELAPRAKQLAEELNRFGHSLIGALKALDFLENDKLNEMTGSIRLELTALANRLQEAAALIERLSKGEEESERVRWIEAQNTRMGQQVSIVDAQLDIATPLANALFSKFRSVVLCSATLSSGRNFSFVRNRLGLTKEFLPQRTVNESVYDSPFDYPKQSIFAVLTDMPEPNSKHYTLEAAKKIEEIVKISRGNAFVLFTSFGMLKECYHLLYERLQSKGFNLLKQGDGSKAALLEQFKNSRCSVLFGTDSFWEGVDVVGEALRCVIIAKLPFQVPTEPIIQGRTESIAAMGKSPFMEYLLPQAIVKFKQGFGRLIRHRKDRGCVVCLDPRVASKAYGNIIIQSLPPAQRFFGTALQLIPELEKFFKTTYYLTK